MDTKKTKHISFKISGEKITADRLRRGIGDFYSLLEEISTEVSGSKKSIKWVVSVKSGSIEFVTSPEPVKGKQDFSNEIISAFGKGLSSLENSPKRPKYFTDKALESVEDLAFLPKKGNGLSGITIYIERKPHELTLQSAANVDEILGARAKSLGSIEGKLLTISQRGSSKFYVYNSIDDKPVKCNVGDDLFNEAMEAFGRRVNVFGVIRYGKDGTVKSISAEEINVFPEKEKIPTASDVCGILGA